MPRINGDRHLAAADMWVPPPIDGPPAAVFAAIQRGEWDVVRRLGAAGDLSWGRHGRQAMHVAAALPLGVDPVFAAGRTMSAYEWADWSQLDECLASDVDEATRLTYTRLREQLLAGLHDRREQTLQERRSEYPLSARFGLLRRLGRQWVQWRNPQVAQRQAAFRLLQDAMRFGLAEALAGRLDVARSMLAGAADLGALDDWFHDVRTDLVALIDLARGGSVRRPYASRC